ncbi:hypothetical protein MRB53_020430 [Persea americana]|uniref:Uncharacterized protein n=1 Tax=Persea americana TaxID=3435 RepID=A0ACC2L190_PERAE|nr:hypothetical protein MRB53_020430 [Persea americana]
MSLTELIPIGAVLSVLTNELLETASAAKDVLIDKESFAALSKYLYDIEPVLEELQRRELNDSQAARQALGIFKEDVKKAKYLVEKYKNCGRFYLLIKCRSIVKEVQEITRNIGRSLAALSLASTEILADISETVNRLHIEMQKAEFVACQSQLKIVEKLDQGLQEHKVDQTFANIILEDIARAVGVPIEPSEISKELDIFRKEKEEAAARKEQAEVLFLEQVIKLLSRADAANDQEEVRARYYRRVQSIEGFDEQNEYIPPLKAFMCPIEKMVMVDPVSLCTGTACERTAIQAWIDSGKRTDPETGQFLDDLSLVPNIGLWQTIEEWRELNYCIRIRSVKGKLQSGIDLDAEEALSQIRKLIGENPINRDWVAFGGIINILVPLLGSLHNRKVKIWALVTLRVVVEGHSRNKDKVVEFGGLDHVIHCLGRSPNVSKAAIELLFELLLDGSGWNSSLLNLLAQKNSAFIFLVALLNGTITESAAKAEAILLKLCDGNDDNISRAADANWYKPLINRLCQGSESSKISMAGILVKTELTDQNVKLLGEEGVIPPLVQMISGGLESKRCALSALFKLSRSRENKKLVAAAGGVLIVLEQLFSSHVPTLIREKCSEILERFCSEDGIKFLVDADGAPPELDPFVTNLLAIQQNPDLYYSIRKPALRTLLAICKFEEVVLEKIVASLNGVSVILPLLEHTDMEVRGVTVKLLSLFSQRDPHEITEFLLQQSRLKGFVCFLEDESRSDVQIAAVGILAHLPKSNERLTKNLIELNVLPMIFKILNCGNMEGKENALSALFRFSDPSNIDAQQMIVDLGAYPLFVSILKFGTVTAKERAAILIANLSLSSPKLAVVSVMTSCKFFRRAHIPVCEAHGGLCTVTTSFCLLKANALPDLVKLLQERVHETAYAAVQALATLVQEEFSCRGANVLHKANAISPMLDVLNWGTDALKEEVLRLLEKVFEAKEVATMYCSLAKIPLVGLAIEGRDNRQLGRRAARVLAYLEASSSSISVV